MKKGMQKKAQLDSLRKTTSTKEQVLKTIVETPINELLENLPEAQGKISKQEIEISADKLLMKGPGVGQFSEKDIITEAIIQKFGRPVFLIQDDKPQLKGNDVEKFKSLIQNSLTKFGLVDKIRSVGRVETTNLPGYDWLGTGWLFENDLLVTNRHVAEAFIESRGGKLSPKNFFGRTVASRIDFLAEYGSMNAAECDIIECLYLAPKTAYDIAVFRIKTNNNLNRMPISVLQGDAREREDVAVIGYPAYDSRTNSIADMERIYEKIYDVKRFAPGKIIASNLSEGILVHDATTLGGCSGSVVLSLETGRPVGLHFAGREAEGNYCVSTAALRKVLNQLPKKIYPVGSPTETMMPDMNDITVEMVPRSCALEPYTPVRVPDFKISGRIVTYASPDSTYAVTKRMFESASESILIGIYDFSAEHMIGCIKDAIDRGVKVSLMLDIDSDKESEVFKKLKRYGVECVPAPSCASKNVSYFSSSHEKVIVIDEQWTLIQSGNYSDNSIPFNESDGKAGDKFRTGNRDMGIALESKPLAKFFTKILRSDMRLEQSAAGEESLSSWMASSEFLIEAPRKRPEILFASEEFNPKESVSIQPVLSPDNYMDVIPELLRTAKHSIKIEQQYIRIGQDNINTLLDAILDAKTRSKGKLKVQIIVAPPIGKPDKTYAEIKELRKLGFEVCMLSKKHFVHCHNKLIVIDDKAVLISSQNWSDSAVTKNREAGVIIYNEEITSYYSRIFDADWTMSEDAAEEMPVTEVVTSLESYGSQPGRYVIIDGGDFQEV